MTFNANIPDTTQSPGLFPAQANTNFSRLQTLVNAEHVFNNTAQANDGVHRQSTYVSRADPVSLPAGTQGMVYFASNRAKGYDGTTVYYLPGILAAVTFNNTGTKQGVGTNVTNVTKLSPGQFVVNFTNPINVTQSQFSVNAYSNALGVNYTAGLSQPLTTTSAAVTIRNASTGAVVDPALCSVVFYIGY